MKQFSFALKLEFDEASNEVTANLVPSFDLPKITREKIDAELTQGDFSKFFILEDNIEELLALDQTLRDQGQKVLLVTKKKLEMQDAKSSEGDLKLTAKSILELVNKSLSPIAIAQKKDSEVEITTCEDEINAYITLHPPYGGELATEESIMAAIEAAGITTDINHSAVEKGLLEGRANKLPLTKGVKPRKGKDSKFEPLIDTVTFKGPTIDENDKADFHDIYDFAIVEPGTELMRRSAPANGKNGMNVFGKPILAEPGDKLPFSVDMEGATVSEEDPDLVIATAKGHPIFHARGASVDNILKLKNASLATGNIKFDGSVCIEGDVSDGIEIEATGDVTVFGSVGKATINAGSNIKLCQGLIGGTKSSQNQTSEELVGAFLFAGKNVTAKFASYAQIKAGERIEIEEYASHCQLTADKEILLGKTRGTGNLIGGDAQAFDTIFARSLGGAGGPQTNLRVGAAEDTIIKLRTVSQKINTNTRTISENAEQLNKLAIWAKVAGINAQTKEKIENINEENKRLVEENIAFETEANELKNLLLRTKRARIIVTRGIFHNVCLSILNYQHKVKEETHGGKFRFDARQIIQER